MNQPQLFETEDQYGNDIIQGPKLVKRKLTTKCLVFVVYVSYK